MTNILVDTKIASGYKSGKRLYICVNSVDPRATI